MRCVGLKEMTSREREMAIIYIVRGRKNAGLGTLKLSLNFAVASKNNLPNFRKQSYDDRIILVFCTAVLLLLCIDIIVNYLYTRDITYIRLVYLVYTCTAVCS